MTQSSTVSGSVHVLRGTVDSEPGFNGFVSWITSDDNVLWADVCERPVGRACELWRFDGPDLTPVFHVSDHGATGAWIVGNAATGLYSSVEVGNVIDPSATATWRIITINPKTGAITDVAALVLPPYWEGPSDTGTDDAVIYRGRLYLVTPPGLSAASGKLDRINLPS